ncbi:MAG: peptide-methionine (S)-S-oxide reductase MsrA [Pseudomonadota bacterium]
MTRLRMLVTAGAIALGFGVGIASAEDSSGKVEAAPANTATAIFAGGCFWCVESDFDKLDGVLSTVSGYTGGHTKNPTYKEVVYGNTGHYEAVRITYDPEKVDYRTLVDYFLRHVDPTDDGGQFCDRGHSYTTAIFVDGPEERAAAEAALAVADEVIEDEIVTPILPVSEFTDAEEYHQDYYLKNPLRYRYYRFGCGRDARVDEVWGEARHS